MKKLIILTCLVVLLPATAQAQRCGNSTCITIPMITTSNHAAVPFIPSLTHYDYLLADRGYTAPTLTGARVYRQFAPGKIGITDKYPDAFCLREGAAYGGDANAGRICP